jgi:hypothetical protein
MWTILFSLTLAAAVCLARQPLLWRTARIWGVWHARADEQRAPRLARPHVRLLDRAPTWTVLKGQRWR